MFIFCYYYCGLKHGFVLNPQIIDIIQSSLEKRVASYIFRHSKKISPIRSKLYMLQNYKHNEPLLLPVADNEYGSIIEARAVARRFQMSQSRQKSITEAIETYKTHTAELEVFVKKVERSSEKKHRQFLLGTARHGDVPENVELIPFKSQVYREYSEIIRKEIESYED